MKTAKCSVLFLVASIVTTCSFAQSIIGVQHSANAAVNASVRAAAAQSATNAATRASVQAATNTRAAAGSAATRAAEINAATMGHTKAAVAAGSGTVLSTTTGASNAGRANAGIKAQGSVHASEKAHTQASEQSVLLRTGAGSQTNTGVQVNGKQTTDVAVKASEEVSSVVGTTATATHETKAQSETRIKSDAEKAARAGGATKSNIRSKSQGSVHASGQAKQHASEHSAVLGTSTATSTDQNIKADQQNVNASGAIKTSGKVSAGKH